jgi:hypothetical protein
MITREKYQAREFSPETSRALPLTAAERARLIAIVERSDRLMAKDPSAIAEAEKLARRAAHKQKRARQTELCAHLDQTVEGLVERYGHWRCRDIGKVADEIRVELQSLAGPERWSTDGIDRSLAQALK